MILLDTPGGLVSSMEDIVKAELASPVPVIVYVSPEGASATSAGAFIAQAGDLLAMAPQTTIGSSTPVGSGGENLPADLREKAIEKLSAQLRGLARDHGRNPDVGERAVRSGDSWTAEEALDENVIDLIAPDLATLLNEADGRTTKPKGLVLETANADVTLAELSLWQQILDLLIDPNVIFVMVSIGLIGIVVELWNPGMIFPGTVGAISLIISLFAAQVLPVNWAGFLLMLLAAVFIGAEPFVASHGALTVAGAVCFVLGGPAALRAVRRRLRGVAAAADRRRRDAGGPDGAGRRQDRAGAGEPRRGRPEHDRRDERRRPERGAGVRERRALARADRGRRAAAPGRRGRGRADGRAGARRASARRVGSRRPRRKDSMAFLILIGAAAFLLLIFLSAAIKVAREYERGVVFRLGRLLQPPKGPGLFLLIPVIDRMVRVDLRTITLNVPPQEVITKDNVPVRVNAVAYFRIVDPSAAIVQVENFMVATSQIAQTTLRSVLGQHLLDELLSERDKINAILQQIIDEATAPWGIKVSIVEVKDVEIPAGMQRAMARQAEAERERRAKVIAAEGEFQASERLKDAALVMADTPIALQLRYLQTLLELGPSASTTIVFPAPIDLFRPFIEKSHQGQAT